MNQKRAPTDRAVLSRTFAIAGSLLLAGVVTAALALAMSGAPAAAVAAPSGEWRVCPAGPGTCDFATVQEAVDAAGPGDVIKVAEGVYTDLHVREGMTQVAYITESVTIRGGYTTSDWETSDPAVHATTLDAGGHARVVVIDRDGGQVVTVTLNGLRVTNGRPLGEDWGAGIYARYANLVIADCHVFSNSAGSSGGGVDVQLSDDLLLRSNQIYSNTALSGAGVYIGDCPDARVEENRVYGNQADVYWGGGIRLSRSHGTAVLGNEIHNNAALSSGGGGIALLSSDHVTIAGNLVYSNVAAVSGGGIFISGPAQDAVVVANNVYDNRASSSGGGVYFTAVLAAAVRDNRITGNLATIHGGGLYAHALTPTVEGNLIYSNTAYQYYGGGAYLSNSSAFTVVNNVIADNWAGSAGDGVYVKTSAEGRSVGKMAHNTLVENGRGLGDEAIYLRERVTLTLTNNLITGHEVGLYLRPGLTNTATADHTLFFDNEHDTHGDTIISTNAITGQDPLFVDRAAGDYHLRRGSPAIDAGADVNWLADDIDGDDRPLGDGYDIGADEVWAAIIYLPLVVRALP
jgi:parallel beta-helix repeat protein